MNKCLSFVKSVDYHIKKRNIDMLKEVVSNFKPSNKDIRVRIKNYDFSNIKEFRVNLNSCSNIKQYEIEWSYFIRNNPSFSNLD